MKLVITMALTMSGDATIDDVRRLRSTLAAAAYPCAGVGTLEDIYATLDIETRSALRPLAKAGSPVALADSLQRSVAFMKAVKESGIREEQAKAFLALLPAEQAHAIVEQARSSLRGSK